MLAFIQYISTWCDEFNCSLTLHGSNFGANNQHHIPALGGYNPLLRANVVDATNHVGFFIDAAGRCQFYGSDAFFSQFFMVLDEDFATLVGLPEILWAGTSIAGNLQRIAGEPVPPDNLPAELYEEQPGGPVFLYQIQADNNGNG